MRILMIVVMVKGILLWFYISTGDNDDSTSNDDKITSDVNGAHPRIMIVWPAAARKGWSTMKILMTAKKNHADDSKNYHADDGNDSKNCNNNNHESFECNNDNNQNYDNNDSNDDDDDD